MSIFEKFEEKLRAESKSIVFTEGTDARILSAASRLLAGKTLRRTAVAVALTVVFLAVCVFSLTTFSNLYFSDDITSTIAAVRNDGSAVFALKKDHISYGSYGLNMIINGGDTSPVTDEELEQAARTLAEEERRQPADGV